MGAHRITAYAETNLGLSLAYQGKIEEARVTQAPEPGPRVQARVGGEPGAAAVGPQHEARRFVFPLQAPCDDDGYPSIHGGDAGSAASEPATSSAIAPECVGAQRR